MQQTAEPRARDRLLARLEEPRTWDVLVAGGGATGLGVALEASLRGFSVLLAEAGDFACGTSSRSTKLLHGGVRYLAQGRLSLVREALAERQTLLALAPHLAQPLAFVMPVYRWWEGPFYGAGLWLYQALAGHASLGPTQWLSRSRTLQALPGLQSKGLIGGIRYWDAQFDDARLALELAHTAGQQGALLLNHIAVEAVQPAPEGGHMATLRDRLGGVARTVRARCVVNATGVWVDGLRKLQTPADSGGRVAPLVSPSQGVHVVVDRSLFPGREAMLVPRTRDGRVLFAVPWLGSVILGTTDTARPDTPPEPRPLPGELEFILGEASAHLARPVSPADVRSVWVGLRPLVQSGALADPPGATRNLSREHTVEVAASGLVTVTGGKWTTFRVMAQDVLAACETHGLLPKQRARGPWRLNSTATGYRGGMAQDPFTWAGVPTADQNAGLTDELVRWHARNTQAVHVADVLARRTRLLFTDAKTAAELAPAVAATLREETGLDPDLDGFLALCRQYGAPWEGVL